MNKNPGRCTIVRIIVAGIQWGSRRTIASKKILGRMCVHDCGNNPIGCSDYIRPRLTFDIWLEHIWRYCNSHRSGDIVAIGYYTTVLLRRYFKLLWKVDKTTDKKGRISKEFHIFLIKNPAFPLLARSIYSFDLFPTSIMKYGSER